MRQQHRETQTFERTLYAAQPPAEKEEDEQEVVRFGGFPFVRTVAGEWRLLQQPASDQRD